MREWGERSPYRAETTYDAREYITQRFLDMAVARTLQIDRQLDIKSVKAAIGGRDACDARIAGRISKYSQAGAIAKDADRWRLIDPGIAAQMLKERMITPLSKTAMEAIKGRDKRASKSCRVRERTRPVKYKEAA